MQQNKIVARYMDGRLQKGITMDFIPGKDTFHIMPTVAAQGDKLREVKCSDLKAVFFVKDFAGNPDYEEKLDFGDGKPIMGRRIRVRFKDGELMIGATGAYQPGRTGFFLAPADPKSNNERCYVVTQATSEIRLI